MESTMKILVADASSLILLTKTGVLSILCETASMMIPASVEREVCGPAAMKKHADAVIVSGLIESGKIQVESVRLRRRLHVSLGRGEREAILLFLQEDADLILTDDGRAIRACRMLKIPFSASPRIVLDLQQAGRMSRKDARRALEKLSVLGRYSIDVIAAAFEKLAADDKEKP